MTLAGSPEAPCRALEKRLWLVPRERACVRCAPRTDIHIDNINVTLFGRELLVEASLALNWGNRWAPGVLFPPHPLHQPVPCSGTACSDPTAAANPF